ncbi:MAG: DNA-binding protein WhiA [Clostridiales bacterium]|nr:DNA-binding protein WhiA [Clostridiales bacterium]
MNFLINAKKEVSKNLKKSLNSNNSLSFLYALFKTIGEINLVASEINFITNNEEIFALTNIALKKLNFLEAEFEIDDDKIFNNAVKYKIIINKKTSECLLNEFVYKTDFKFNDELTKTEVQKVEFLKGIFLTTITGNISLNKETSGYLMEFVLNDELLSSELSCILSEFDIFVKKVVRNKQFVIYINKFDIISDVLALVGANNSMLAINNENAIRSVRNNINRQNNCLEANINKTINASLKQLDAINFIDSTIGINNLDSSLQEICLLRLANKEESLDNLVKLLNGKISKSGLNHRFNKIIKISNELKDKF